MFYIASFESLILLTAELEGKELRIPVWSQSPACFLTTQANRGSAVLCTDRNVPTEGVKGKG